MKRLILSIIFTLLLCGNANADSAVTGYPENTTPVSTDIMYLVDDPGGTPASNKITVGNLFGTEDVIFKASFGDQDWGDLSVSSNSITLDADVVGTDEMANEDHGMVAWSGGAATVEDFALNADADAGDYDIQSIDKLEGYDALVYIDMGTDGYIDLEADTGIRITAPTDFGDEDLSSLDKLEFYDSGLYIDGGADGILNVVSDTTMTLSAATLNLPWQQVMIVAKAGGEYTTIQGAIDAITDNTTAKRYVVFIFPGTYTENVVMEEYVSLVGFDHETTHITSASGVTVTAPSGTSDASIKDLKLSSTPTADGAEVLKITTGEVDIYDSYLKMTSSTNGVEGTLLNIDGGTVKFEGGELIYDMNGSVDASIQTHSIVDIDGTVSFSLWNNKIDVDVADEDDTVILIDEASAAAIVSHISYCDIHFSLSHATYDGLSGFLYAHGTSALKELTHNILFMDSSGDGTAYGIYMDTSGGNGVIYSTANQIHITGFTNNYGLNMAAGDTFTSHFDDIQADGGNTGAGTVTAVQSPSDGNFLVTGTMSVGSTLTFGTDTLTSAELLDTLSDETGTGVAVFGTAPTFTTSITVGSNVITEAEAGYLEDVTSSVQDQFTNNDTVADESADTTCFPAFFTAATGILPPKTGTNLTFNSNTGYLTATNIVGTTYGSDGSVTDAELLYVDATSSIQTQLNAIPDTAFAALTTGDNYVNIGCAAGDDTIDELFACIDTYWASVSMDEDEIEAFIFDADVETVSGAWLITGNLEVQDDTNFSFGNDDDVSWAWDSAAARLELRSTGSDADPEFWFDLTNKAIATKAVSAPEMGLYDIDATGAERTDEYAGGIGANLDTVTEDATDSTVSIYYMDNSVKTTGLTIGGTTPGADFQALPVTTTGAVSGGKKIVVTTGNMDADAYCYGGVIIVDSNHTITLPPVDVGMSLKIISSTNNDNLIDPDGSEVFRLNGTDITGGYMLKGTNMGEWCELYYHSAGVWYAHCSGYVDNGS